MIRNLLIARIDELLTKLGFARNNTSWTRRASSFVDVIDAQTSKGGDRFTINAGVLHTGVYLKCWGVEAAAVIQEPECIVRVRIGDLVDGRDLWWPLDDVRLVEDVIDKLTGRILPFLDSMHSLKEMEHFLTTAQVTRRRYPLPIIYLAILQGENGDKASACALLGELGAKAVGAWKSRVNDVAVRMRCP